ncbi:MAG: hypothetical protein AAFW84_13930 [Cyanobacteria bacterium J06635_15]
MAYSDFNTLEKARKALGIVVSDQPRLVANVPPIAPSEMLRATLEENLTLASAISTEKARSELLIAPILLEVRRIHHHRIGFFSGIDFTVDPSRELNGACDFILTASSEQSILTAPVMTIVEAKNENLKSGLGQCVAQMVAAQCYNEREGTPQSAIYGAVATGTNWKFLILKDTTVQVDLSEYYITQIDQILGILASSLTPQPAISVAS